MIRRYILDKVTDVARTALDGSGIHQQTQLVLNPELDRHAANAVQAALVGYSRVAPVPAGQVCFAIASRGKKNRHQSQSRNEDYRISYSRRYRDGFGVELQ